jgi:hypothetical protein
MRKTLCFVLPTFLLFLFSSSSSRSLPQESGSLVPIIAKSDLIVVGEVVSREAKWADGIRTIDTYITISVEEYIKGSSPSTDIVLRYPGGRIEEEKIELIASAPRPLFNLKEKVIVMLRLLPDQKHYILTDIEGKLSIDRRGKVIGPNTCKQDFVRMIKDIVASQKK